jgi:23S rRNA (guanosine2251-2'-O)-methyltransferase
LSIPMAAGVESLNVASAAAVVCFEAARRQGVRAAGVRAGGGRT